MVGNYQEAIGNIEESMQLEQPKKTDPSNDTKGKLKVQTLSDNLILGDKLSQKTISSMNKAAILLCAGNLEAAKEQLDELLKDQSLNLITENLETEEIIPSYLIQMLVYFLIKTSK